MLARTISRLAVEAGVGVETIRYYERRGLLRQPVKATSGWREYGEQAVWTVKYIRQAQQLGFSLRELKGLLENTATEQAFCAAVRGAVKEKLSECERQISALEARRNELERFISACASRPASEGCPIARNLRIRQFSIRGE